MTFDPLFVLEAENCPEELLNLWDRPWHEKTLALHPSLSGWGLQVCCAHGNARNFLVTEMPEIPEMRIGTVFLRPYKFIDGDMLIHRIYIGACDKCPKVHVVQEGPPLSRAQTPYGVLA